MIDLGQCRQHVNAKPLPHEPEGLITLFDTATGTAAEAWIFTNQELMRTYPIINGNQISIDNTNKTFLNCWNQCCYTILIVDADCNLLDVTSDGVTGNEIKICFNMPCTDETQHVLKFIAPPVCEDDSERICLC